MSLKEEIVNYADYDGLVAPGNPVPPGTRNATGNGVLYSSEYKIILALRGELTEQDAINFTNVIKGCEIVPGLYNRGPIHPDQNAHDDYVGLSAASYFLKTHHAPAILEYGQKNYGKLHGFRVPYYYNNVRPGSSVHPDGRINYHAWIGRMPPVIAHFYWSAGKKPNILLQLIWAIGIWWGLGGNPQETSGRLIAWLMILVAERQSFIGRLMGKMFRKDINKLYKNGMKDVFAIYFGENHPMTKYLPENW